MSVRLVHGFEVEAVVVAVALGLYATRRSSENDLAVAALSAFVVAHSLWESRRRASRAVDRYAIRLGAEGQSRDSPPAASPEAFEAVEAVPDLVPAEVPAGVPVVAPPPGDLAGEPRYGGLSQDVYDLSFRSGGSSRSLRPDRKPTRSKFYSGIVGPVEGRRPGASQISGNPMSRVY